MLHVLQPYIQEIVLAIVGLLSTIIIAAMFELRTRVLNWIDSRKNANEKEYCIISPQRLSPLWNKR